ncbi:MAG: hypothetical protein KGI04_00650 [Candidatus Micrarchaeota archaeon]|nr:hypothetical protein [Candidatus Micrarchaeota archaeon]
MERKQLIELIGSIFVAAIFLSSYAAFGNTSLGNNATTTAAALQTYYAVARGNATIQSYSSVMNVNVSCSNLTAAANRLNSKLITLEQNGSVNNFYSQQAGRVLVQAGNVSTYPLFYKLAESMGDYAVCTAFTTSVNVELPSKMTFTVSSQKTSVTIAIPSNLRAYSVPVTLAGNMSGALPVSATTLLTVNGSIYGSIRVQPA